MNIKYICVNPSEHRHYLDGFTHVYKEAFGGAPYFEHYDDDQVLNDVWLPHLISGIIILALDDGHVIGLGCAKPLPDAPKEDQDFIYASKNQGSLQGGLDSMWYMSELAVLTEYRRQGIGNQLVAERLREILKRGGDRYIFRTASEGSNSAQLYTNIGAKLLPGLVDVTKTPQVQVNESQSHERIFFYGLCATTISAIQQAPNAA